MADGANEVDPVRVERDGEVAVVILDDPPLNLFRTRTFDRLREATEEVASSDARACVFRAAGDTFTAGVDVSEFAKIDGATDGAELAERGMRDISTFESLEIPTLALIHGLCLTAGWEAALGCDMIWAATDCKVGLVERVVGLTPFGGGVQRMAERAGPARAREFVMTGALYEAETMLDWGVINRVVGTEELKEEGMAFAAELAAGPTIAHGATKKIIRAYLDGGIEAADAAVPEIAGALFATDDLKGAVESFLSEGPGKASFQGK